MIMPYREKTLAGANANALAEELRAELDAALTAHPAWTKVTSAYAAGTTWIHDVWQNDGTADGYGWFLVVAKHKTAAVTSLGGMLEYDPVTWIAKKALRGTNGLGFVDAAGYPLVSSGGDEMTFPLSAFTNTTTNTVGVIAGNALPTAATAGNWVRTLVTDRLVWQGYGSPTAIGWSTGVGTYQNIHSTTQDLKPLAFIGCMATAGTTSAWQHPSATEGNVSRTVANWNQNTGQTFQSVMVTVSFGQVGGDDDLLVGGPVGARYGVVRSGTTAKTSTVYAGTAGIILGLAPADFLIFNRTTGCAIGDTITVDGKTYVSVNAPLGSPGLFVNTQPDI